MKLIKIDKDGKFDWCIEGDMHRTVATSNMGAYDTKEIRDAKLAKTILDVKCDGTKFTVANGGRWAMGSAYDIYFPIKYAYRQDALTAINHVRDLLRDLP